MTAFQRWRNRVFGFNSFNRDEWVARMAASLPPGARILDAGAGPGPYRHLFAHCDYRTQDFGQTPATLGRYTKLDYECDITAIPVPDGTFDAVLCTEVLEHVPEPVKAVRELARVLRPGGRLFMTAPLGAFLHQEPYHFYGGYTPYFYRKFLPEAGLEIETLERNEGFFSLFGQEALRYVELLGEPAVKRMPLAARGFAFVLRWMMKPLARLFAVAGNVFDRHGIEQMATIGYHVVAVKRTP
jgi:SAM-dependent methyltransferase